MQRKVEIEKRERAKKARECGGKATPEQIEKRSADTPSDKRSEPKEKKDTRAATAKTHKIPERKLRGIDAVAKAKPEMVQEIADGKVTVAQALCPWPPLVVAPWPGASTLTSGIGASSFK